MAQSKLLLDTNSYLRLAKSIHPLLFVVFGEADYCLYVLKELDDEVSRNPRLRTKFSWVSEPQYRENRSKRLTLSRAQRREVESAFGFLWDHVVNELPGPSPVDCRALAYGFVLKVPVVTDDEDMKALASVFDIEVMGSLDLMNLMLESEHVSMDKVRRVVAYWSYEIDRPKDCRRIYKKLFGEPAPL